MYLTFKLFHILIALCTQLLITMGFNDCGTSNLFPKCLRVGIGLLSTYLSSYDIAKA